MHYASEATAGFYDENIYTYPAGYLVHNLEHGYVIFWYNCDLLDEAGCSNLKSQIRTVIDDLGGTKIIAYPWNSIDVPLVMTSWGRLQRFESFGRTSQGLLSGQPQQSAGTECPVKEHHNDYTCEHACKTKYLPVDRKTLV